MGGLGAIFFSLDFSFWHIHSGGTGIAHHMRHIHEVENIDYSFNEWLDGMFIRFDRSLIFLGYFLYYIGGGFISLLGTGCRLSKLLSRFVSSLLPLLHLIVYHPFVCMYVRMYGAQVGCIVICSGLAEMIF
jgi:hypothetical protein